MNNAMEKIAFIQGYEMGKAAMLKAAQEEVDDSSSPIAVGAEGLLGAGLVGTGGYLARNAAKANGGYLDALRAEAPDMQTLKKTFSPKRLKNTYTMGNGARGVKDRIVKGVKKSFGNMGGATGGTAAGILGVGLLADAVRRGVESMNKAAGLESDIVKANLDWQDVMERNSKDGTKALGEGFAGALLGTGGLAVAGSGIENRFNRSPSHPKTKIVGGTIASLAGAGLIADAVRRGLKVMKATSEANSTARDAVRKAYGIK